MERENALLDYFVPPGVGYRLESLVATTYQMDFDFLESELLPTMLGVKSRGAALQAFRADLEAQLERCDVTVLYDLRGAVGCRSSPRIDALGVSRKKLHAKIYLMLWSRRGKAGQSLDRQLRMVIGSPNLTKSAFRSNYEVAAVLDFGRDDGSPKHLLGRALEIVATVGKERPSPQLKRQLRLMGEFHDRLPRGQGGANAPWRLVDSKEVMPGLRDALRTQSIGRPLRFIAVSPFWAGGKEPWKPVVDFVSGLGVQPPVVELICEGHRVASGEVIPVMPREIGPATARELRCKVRIRPALPNVGVRELAGEKEDEGEASETDGLAKGQAKSQDRSLHAKIFAVEGTNGAVLYIGSSNFTRRGLGGNTEAGLVYRLQRRWKPTLEALLAFAGEGVEVEKGRAPKVEEPLEEEEQQVPTFMRDVVGTATGISILFSATGNVPTDLVVLAPEQAVDRYRLLLKGRPASTRVAISLAKCPTCDGKLKRKAADGGAVWEIVPHVEIRWGQNTCLWPVRYDDKSALRRDGKLTGHSETELIEFFRTGKEPGTGSPPPTFEPAPPVRGKRAAKDSALDTSRILSYQVRRFIEALPGIVRTLEDAGYSEPALRTVLLGPTSPLELATRAVEALGSPRPGEPTKTPVAVAFQLVELIAILERLRRTLDVRLRPLVRSGEDRLIKMLDRLQRQHPGIEGLKSYRALFVSEVR